MSEQRKPDSERLRPPVPVQVAFWIWVASAVLSLVSAVLTPREKGEIITALTTAKPQGITPAQYGQYANTLITVSIVTLVLFAALYVFFAYQVRAGKNWARLTLTVLMVIGVAYDAYTGTLLSSGLGLLISAVAVILVYFPSASAFFAAHKRLR